MLPTDPKLQLVSLFFVGAVFFCSGTNAEDGLLLDCDRFEGDSQFQIYINEDEGYVLYNADVRKGNHERKREYRVVGGEEGEVTEIDDGLNITLNTRLFLMASDGNSNFLLAKETATFAYAWTQPIENKEGK